MLYFKSLACPALQSNPAAVVLVRVPLDIFDPDTGRLLSRPERAYCFDPETNKEDIVMNVRGGGTRRDSRWLQGGVVGGL